jgi:hypothetical protein
MLKTLSSVLVALGIFASSGAASADPRVEIRVRTAPPPVRVETVRERPGYFWVDGNYDYHHGRYMWHRGHWQHHRRNFEYVPGRWEERGDHHVWVRPSWRRH